ncbi:SIR2 family protein [Pseudocolwellia sp. HL-MZ7]|uniref:SIR2 family protein n=1 Tax=Pseudocolwellia sp. HL-MZ7 TaxID=3400627 RepID=UPI003CECEE41
MANFKQFLPKDEYFIEYMARVFQSSNINILLGSGASNPAISVAGDIESKLQELYDKGDIEGALELEYDFIGKVQEPTNRLIHGFPIFEPVLPLLTSEKTQQVVTNRPYQPTENVPLSIKVENVLIQYETLVSHLLLMLQQRKTQLLPKKVNIFTTNYDLFVEKAALKHKGVVLNDGFQNRSSLCNEYQYDTRSFSRVFYESSAVYDYKVELPVLNLIKMHGSLSWKSGKEKKNKDKIVYNVEHKGIYEDIDLEQKKKLVDEYTLIFPKKEKFKTVLLNHTYYDLMRLYSNELDKEQTTLVAFGFSFADEHILDLTKRALRNSTLKIMIFAYDEAASQSLIQIFDRYNNVDIIFPEKNETLCFEQFNEAISCYLSVERSS